VSTLCRRKKRGGKLGAFSMPKGRGEGGREKKKGKKKRAGGTCFHNSEGKAKTVSKKGGKEKRVK